MHHLELAILVLLVAVVGLTIVATWARQPYPIALVLGGLGLGLIPGVPEIELEPELVLVIFLPPLLYGAAFFTSLRDLRANVRPIAMLSIGMVAITMAAVAAVAHWVMGLDWGVAFVLGAIVSPTDAVAPASVLRRFDAPRRLLTIVEGENLTNDWTALVLYRFAVAAVVTGTFSLGEASVEFLLTGVGGLAVGLLAGRIIREVRRRVNDPPTEITISLASGYLAYLPAEELGVSGVIAAVTVGIYMGWHTPELTTPLVRIQGVSVWQVLRFVLEAFLFLLVGLQMPQVIDSVGGHSTGELLGWAALVSAVVIASRILWLFVLPGRRGAERAVLAWCGMRGAVSLAAALALPLETDAGAPFPERDLIVFLAFSVIIATLVGQGLTLGPLLRRLGVEDDGSEEREEIEARIAGAEAQLARLEELAGEDWVRDDTAERARALLRWRQRRFRARIDGDDTSYDERSGHYVRTMRALLAAERERLLELRNDGTISENVRRRIERDLDYEESRLTD